MTTNWSEFYFWYDSSQLSQCLSFLEPKWQEGWTNDKGSDLAFVVINKALVSIKLGMSEAAQSEIDACAGLFGFQKVASITSLFYQLQYAVDGAFWLVSDEDNQPIVFNIPQPILTGLFICQAEIYRCNEQYLQGAELLRLYALICKNLHRYPWGRIYKGVVSVPPDWAGDVSLTNTAAVCELRASTLLCQLALHDGRRYIHSLVVNKFPSSAGAKVLAQKTCIEVSDKERCQAYQRALEIDHPGASKVGSALTDILQKSPVGHLKCGQAAEVLLARLPPTMSSLATRSLALIALKNWGVMSLCINAKDIPRATELAWLALADVLNIQVQIAEDQLPNVALASSSHNTCILLPSLLRNARYLNRFLPHPTTKDTLLRQLLSEVDYRDKDTLMISFSRL